MSGTKLVLVERLIVHSQNEQPTQGPALAATYGIIDDDDLSASDDEEDDNKYVSNNDERHESR